MNRRRIQNLIVAVCASALASACQHLPDAFPGLPKRHVETQRFPVDGDVIGQFAVMSVQQGDTLADVARHFDLGHEELAAANPDVDVWLPDPEQEVLLPLKFLLPDAPRQGMVLNLASMRLFYFPPESPDTVMTYPVGIGRQGWATPKGDMHVIEKMNNPPWTVPASIRREHARKGDPLPAVVPPGPDNPLGEHAIRLSRPSYLIHGTNKPYGVGMRISHGCIRLYPENMSALFPILDIGTSVNIVDQPYLLGWRDGILYLEAHKPLAEKTRSGLRTALTRQLNQIEARHPQHIDWDRVQKVLEREQGIPVAISAGRSAEFDPVRVAHPGRLRATPVVPALDAGAWYVEAGVFETQRPALRFAAMLNHQGPQIPSRVVDKDGRFRIWAGPYPNRRTAQNTAERIGRDLFLNTRVKPPAGDELISRNP